MVALFVIGVFTREGDDTPFLMLHPRGMRKVVRLPVSPLEALALSVALKEDAGGPARPPSLFPELSAPASEHSARLSQDRSLSPALSGLFSHELTGRILNSLGGRLLAVELSCPEEGNFSAELLLKTADGFTRLACRPADGISLALCCGAMIRMPASLLAHAKDKDAAMDALLEYVTPVAEGKASRRFRPEEGGADSSAASPAAGVAPPDAAAFDPADPRQRIINAAKRILEQRGLYESPEKNLVAAGSVSAGQARNPRSPGAEFSFVPVGKGDARPEDGPGVPSPVSLKDRDASGAGGGEAAARNRSGENSAPGGGDAGRRGPHIRVSLVRQRGKGEAEVLEEFHFPAGGIPRAVFGSLGLSRSEVEALDRESSDNDRWATLLRMLSPETKVPM